MLTEYSFDYKNQNIVDSMFLALSQAKNKDKCAVQVSKHSLTYDQLQCRVFSLAKRFQAIEAKCIGILGMRTIDVYEFLLASLVSSITYVPLNPRFNEDKNSFIIRHSQSDLLVICSQQEKYAKRLLLCTMDTDSLSSLKFFCSKDTFNFICSGFSEQDFKLLVNDFTDCSEQNVATLKARISSNIDVLLRLQEQQKVYFFEQEECFVNNNTDLDIQCSQWIKDNATSFVASYQLNQIDLQKNMHILYTSGTTGDPKGVMVSYVNFSAYFYKILKIYNFNQSDVFANCSALTFDISLQDLLCALEVGAKVVCPTDLELLNLAKFIDLNRITVINTVPYNINAIDRLRLIKSNTADTLRISIFIGEPLWKKQVALWHKWYSSSKIYNTYGPTETTVAVSIYEVGNLALDKWTQQYLNSENVIEEEQSALVPIGEAFKSVSFLLLDDNLHPIASDQIGMLYVGGEQVTNGYFKNPNKQKETFIEYNGVQLYNTGDYVKLTKDEFSDKEVFYYIGRNDDMVKVCGVRLSVYDIDEQLSMLTSKKVVSLIYEDSRYHVKHIFAVVEGATNQEAQELLVKAKKKLKNYIQPLDIFNYEALPLNANGKVDRKQLHKIFLDKASTHLK